MLNLIRQGRSFSGHERNCCFLNTGGPRFANVSSATHLDFKDDGRAIVQVDWDRDGDLDLWISNRNAPQVRFLRNDVPGDHHFIALRLRGTTCNRDAIGARVEVVLRDESRRLVKTLRAGDGFLAQNSKWVHFGLGKNAEIEQVSVRWPGGDTERFSGLTADGRFLLVQGSGKAKSMNSRREPIVLADGAAEVGAPKSSSAVFSAIRPLVPPLEYQRNSGEKSNVFQPGKGPVLLVLWAGWCRPCVAELTEIAAHEQQLRDAGLDVVALSVTEIGDRSGLSESEAKLLDRIHFPFQSGLASARLVEVLQILHDHLFALHLPLKVPSSVLIDAEGRLAAIYQGPASIDRVLEDTKYLSRSGQARRMRSIPFPGRWHEPPKSLSEHTLITRLIDSGFLNEADFFTRRLGAVRKELALPLITKLGIAMYLKNDPRASEHFDQVRQIDPAYVEVELALGTQMEKQRRYDKAIALYREALRRNSKSTDAMNNLAWLLATSPDASLRDARAALSWARKAAQASHFKNAGVLDTLAAANAEAGNFEKAIEISRRALTLARSVDQLTLAAKIEEHIALFQSRRPIRIGD